MEETPTTDPKRDIVNQIKMMGGVAGVAKALNVNGIYPHDPRAHMVVEFATAVVGCRCRIIDHSDENVCVTYHRQLHRASSNGFERVIARGLYFTVNVRIYRR